MSRRRPTRGRARPTPRRPVRDDYGEPYAEYAEYADDYDDYDDYDRYPRRGGSGALPWVLVSLFVVGAFALVVVVASRNGDDDVDASASPKAYDLSYQPFEQEYTFFLRHATETTGPTDFETVMGESTGRMKITYSGGGGTIQTDVRKYVTKRPNSGPDQRPPTESPLSGRSFAFQLGPQGGAKLNDPSHETNVMRALVCYLFPDLPSRTVNYANEDRFSWGNQQEMVSKIRFMDGADLDIRKYDMDVIPARPGKLFGRSGVTELKWAGSHGSYAGDAKNVRHQQRTTNGVFSGRASGKLVMDYRTGMPIHLSMDLKEWSKIALHTDNQWIYDDKYFLAVDAIEP